MVIENGDELSNKLMNSQSFCPNCGTVLTFEDSANLAKQHGVSENAIMCHNCHKVFNVILTPDKMTILDEIKNYNRSTTNNPQPPARDYSGFQKKVSRDKKIIIGAIAIVAFLIIIALISDPISYDDTYGVNVEVTDAFSSGDLFYVYGEITPSDVDTSLYTAYVTYYDIDGYEIASSSLYLTENTGEMLLGSAEVDDSTVDNVYVEIVDDVGNVVAQTTHYI
jgi:hypothetical protein